MALTYEQVRELLVLAAAADKRTVDQYDIGMWGDAAVRAGWTFEEAKEAILNHNALNVAYLTPAHISQAILDRRERDKPWPPRYDPERDNDRREVASPEHIGKLIDQLCEEKGWTRRPDSAEDYLSVWCRHPHCKARPGQRCHLPSGQPLLHSPCHDIRERDAKDAKTAKA